MLGSSKMEPPLVKAKLISSGDSSSGKKLLCGEGEPGRGVRTCERSSFVDTKVMKKDKEEMFQGPGVKTMGACRGGFCEKLREAAPMSNGANASQLQDGPTTGQM
ncbi:hypothetical protein DUI87_28820 [Hirundo rustica rustica]|uniref:Uncharacterized protein n=1 Tax=Hirundo rustica rustica TaxID=333673 RepID=A0A3M0J0Y6_HIRRU|nr:hypothetical protein DUI87_28820 [Hirundo rustica rustica]